MHSQKLRVQILFCHDHLYLPKRRSSHDYCRKECWAIFANEAGNVQVNLGLVVCGWNSKNYNNLT